MGDYRQSLTEKINQSSSTHGAKLVLFAGAGLSRRHLLLPSWYELLEGVLDEINSENPLDFFLQRKGNLIDAAKDVSIAVHTWAWGKGKGQFPEELYDATSSHVNFLKHIVAAKISAATAETQNGSGPARPAEIDSLGNLNLQNIVTTNYDEFWELLFGFSAVSGLDSIFHNPKEGVNVLKVHGCLTEPPSMVLLPEDYENYSVRHRYVFSKLLVYFAEHPVLFVGYSLSDPDISELIVETAKALKKQYLENVFVLSMGQEPESTPDKSTRFRVSAESGSAEVNLIKTEEFDWVYQAFPQKSRS